MDEETIALLMALVPLAVIGIILGLFGKNIINWLFQFY